MKNTNDTILIFLIIFVFLGSMAVFTFLVHLSAEQIKDNTKYKDNKFKVECLKDDTYRTYNWR